PPPGGISSRDIIRAIFAKPTFIKTLAIYTFIFSPQDGRDLAQRVRDLWGKLLEWALQRADELCQIGPPPPDPLDPGVAKTALESRALIPRLLKEGLLLLPAAPRQGTGTGGPQGAPLGHGVPTATLGQDEREHTFSDYLDALDAGDRDTLVRVLAQAETDRVLTHIILNLDPQIVEEELGMSLDVIERALLAPGHGPASGHAPDHAPGDAPPARAEGCHEDADAAEWSGLFQDILSYVSGEDTINLPAPAAEGGAPVTRSSRSPRIPPSEELISSLREPDTPSSAREPGYSIQIAVVLTRAYIILNRAPGDVHAFAHAHFAVWEWEPSEMSMRQRMRLNYIMGLGTAAIGEHRAAVRYLTSTYWLARELRDWGAAAICAHLVALIYAVLDECATAGEFFELCLDSLDRY
ncbi:MAG TPA: hypothetical protein VFY89_05090, partial [Ktedonobacterales bacterium]